LCTFHYSLCKALGIETTDRWYTHTHTYTHKHTNDDDVAVLWNQGVHTDTEVTANRPDLITKTKKQRKTCILVYVAIPADRYITHQEGEN